MRGERVIVRDFRGQYLIRRVWEANTEKVYVTDDAGYGELLQGLGTPPVGFPRTDAFRADAESVAAVLGGSDLEERKLRFWRPTNG